MMSAPPATAAAARAGVCAGHQVDDEPCSCGTLQPGRQAEPVAGTFVEGFTPFPSAASTSARSLSHVPRGTQPCTPHRSGHPPQGMRRLERGDDPLQAREPLEASSASSSVTAGTRPGRCPAGMRAPARRPGSRGRPRSSVRRRSGRPRRRGSRSAAVEHAGRPPPSDAAPAASTPTSRRPRPR